ncbi:MAG TPA: FHA domain-containing protein [Solirubrobacterales bacterium]|nr:FHA domain-containing protein [Solirubrobacterales bacterium]
MNCGGAGKGDPIITVSPGTSSNSFDVGAIPGSGTFFCASCGSQLSLRENDRLPECPRCGASEFQRDSIFEPMQEHGQTAEMAVAEATSTPEWIDLARGLLPRDGRFLVCRKDDGEIQVFPIEEGWTRIGRSANADIRLDDPSVSRRHALIVSERPDSLRVLDDRSLNGVFLNGEIIDWGRLEDGDELAIGRFHLVAIER